MGDALRIEGLREFQAALKRADGESQKQLRVVLNGAARLVVEGATPRIARRSGRAAASMRAQSQQRVARVKAGGARVPYYPWLDFGGSVGRNKSVHRPFIKAGRYLYPTVRDRRAMIQEELEDGLKRLARNVGWL